jgi:hypothetical protein
LALMTIEDRTGAWQVGRFEFFHQPTAVVVLDAAVQAPGDQRRPIFHRPALLEMDLAPVAGLGGAPLVEDARVQFGAQAEAMPALAAFKADAAEAIPLGQFPDRDFKNPGCWIKFQNRLIR